MILSSNYYYIKYLVTNIYKIYNIHSYRKTQQFWLMQFGKEARSKVIHTHSKCAAEITQKLTPHKPTKLNRNQMKHAKLDTFLYVKHDI